MTWKTIVLASAVAGLFVGGAHAAVAADDSGAKVKCEGVNACKGQSACKSAKNDCKGQNGCSGQGFKDMTQAECDAAKAKMKEKKG